MAKILNLLSTIYRLKLYVFSNLYIWQLMNKPGTGWYNAPGSYRKLKRARKEKMKPYRNRRGTTYTRTSSTFRMLHRASFAPTFYVFRAGAKITMTHAANTHYATNLT